MPQAFPGAYGWGAEASGGRGGTVIPVTNLNDGGAGSFKEAAQNAATRIVVFTVAGVIDHASPFNIDNPNMYVAGQTAPGSGIVIRGSKIQIGTHNLIFRYLRYRGVGDAADTGLFGFKGSSTCYDIIFDHLSFAWGTDDMLEIFAKAGSDLSNITVQHCLFTEPDPAHPTCLPIGENSSQDKMHHVSVHNNLFSNVGHRNPLVEAGHTEVINNVVYNWGSVAAVAQRSTDQADGPEVDWINNYWERGTKGNDYFVRHVPNNGQDTVAASIYVSGNILPDASQGVGAIIDPEADNWVFPLLDNQSDAVPTKAVHQRLSQLSQPTYPVPIVSAMAARARVLETAGAYQRLNADGSWTNNRDSVDQGAIDDATNDTGPASLPAVPGTAPDVVAGTAYTDTDGDGMPDEWELANGLDPNDASDGPLVRESGYTNIENFLNGAQEEENGEGGGGSVPSPVVILGASSTPQRSLSENTEIDEFWEGYFRDIERAQNA